MLMSLGPSADLTHIHAPVFTLPILIYQKKVREKDASDLPDLSPDIISSVPVGRVAEIKVELSKIAFHFG